MTTPRLFEHDELDSTNEEAFREIAAGRAQHLDGHLAAAQTAGRGRLGRTWVGAPGEGMYLSIVLLGRDSWSLPTPVVLSMTVGLALLQAAERVGLAPDLLALDWPNDLVVAGLPGVEEAPKLAGILIESRNLDPDAPAYVVGVGVNVLQMAFPEALLAERSVSSLALLGCTTTPRELATLFLDELTELLEVGATAPSQVCADYLEASRAAGRRVRVDLGGDDFPEGRAVFLEPDGLRILTDDNLTMNFALEHIRGLRPV